MNHACMCHTVKKKNWATFSLKRFISFDQIKYMLAKGIQIKPKTQILEKTKLITTRYSDPVRSLFVLYEAAPGQKSGKTLWLEDT